MSVTIRDVAREAQVSVATVSRALNNQNNVAPAVRQRVCAVAERLRYTPHHAARSRLSRPTPTTASSDPYTTFGTIGMVSAETTSTGWLK